MPAPAARLFSSATLHPPGGLSRAVVEDQAGAVVFALHRPPSFVLSCVCVTEFSCSLARDLFFLIESIR